MHTLSSRRINDLMYLLWSAWKKQTFVKTSDHTLLGSLQKWWTTDYCRHVTVTWAWSTQYSHCCGTAHNCILTNHNSLSWFTVSQSYNKTASEMMEVLTSINVKLHRAAVQLDIVYTMQRRCRAPANNQNMTSSTCIMRYCIAPTWFKPQFS